MSQMHEHRIKAKKKNVTDERIKIWMQQTIYNM